MTAFPAIGPFSHTRPQAAAKAEAEIAAAKALAPTPPVKDADEEGAIEQDGRVYRCRHC